MSLFPDWQKNDWYDLIPGAGILFGNDNHLKALKQLCSTDTKTQLISHQSLPQPPPGKVIIKAAIQIIWASILIYSLFRRIMLSYYSVPSLPPKKIEDQQKQGGGNNNLTKEKENQQKPKDENQKQNLNPDMLEPDKQKKLDQEILEQENQKKLQEEIELKNKLEQEKLEQEKLEQENQKKLQEEIELKNKLDQEKLEQEKQKKLQEKIELKNKLEQEKLELRHKDEKALKAAESTVESLIGSYRKTVTPEEKQALTLLHAANSQHPVLLKWKEKWLQTALKNIFYTYSLEKTIDTDLLTFVSAVLKWGKEIPGMINDNTGIRHSEFRRWVISASEGPLEIYLKNDYERPHIITMLLDDAKDKGYTVFDVSFGFDDDKLKILLTDEILIKTKKFDKTLFDYFI